jgi:hypothetical protein
LPNLAEALAKLGEVRRETSRAWAHTQLAERHPFLRFR